MFLGSLLIFGLGGSTAGSDIHHVTFVEKMTVQLTDRNKIDATISEQEILNLSISDNRMEVILTDENIIKAKITTNNSLNVALSEG